MGQTSTDRDTGFSVNEQIDAWAALRMISDAIEEIFGPVASLESEEATLLRGPEFHHKAEGIIEALQRVKERTGQTSTDRDART